MTGFASRRQETNFSQFPGRVEPLAPNLFLSKDWLTRIRVLAGWLCSVCPAFAPD